MSDCREMGDPAKDKSLRDHLGCNYMNLENMVRALQWKILFKDKHQAIHYALKDPRPAKLLVTDFCKGGKRRLYCESRVFGEPRVSSRTSRKAVAGESFDFDKDARSAEGRSSNASPRILEERQQKR